MISFLIRRVTRHSNHCLRGTSTILLSRFLSNQGIIFKILLRVLNWPLDLHPGPFAAIGRCRRILIDKPPISTLSGPASRSLFSQASKTIASLLHLSYTRLPCHAFLAPSGCCSLGSSWQGNLVDGAGLSDGRLRLSTSFAAVGLLVWFCALWENSSFSLGLALWTGIAMVLILHFIYNLKMVHTYARY